MSYSQDLWKEFSSSDQGPLPISWCNVTSQKGTLETGLEGDDFGEFESAEPQTIETQLPTSINDPWLPIAPIPRPVDVEAHDSFLKSPAQYSWGEERQPPQPATRLIDASSVAPSKPKSPPISFPAPRLGKNKASSKLPVILPNEDDEWGDFVDNSTPFAPASSGANGESFTTAALDNFNSSNHFLDVSLTTSPLQASRGKPAIATAQEPPPSNVPPPSILLLLIVEIFQSLLLDIKNRITTAGSSKSANAQLDNESVGKIHNRLSVARASARIIAGRKLRWRRDNHLLQSMKIGPANSGKSGGMKLVGIDKIENRREDGEVEEAVRTWKQYIGSLRAAIAAANSRQPGLNLVLPEMSENLPVRMAKASEGALVSLKSCFLCGLKREERIDKVDGKVEDSFGEWWVDHWGHVDCKIFWVEQKGSLDQR